MTTPSKLDEARLRELAEAATPGPWKYQGPPDVGYSTFVGRFEAENGTVVCDFGDSETYYPSEGSPPDPEDAAFIAAANPATILALLDALSAEREQGDRAVASAATAFQALNGIPPHRIIDGLTVEWCVSDDVPEDIYTAKSHLQVVLATQKAEGV